MLQLKIVSAWMATITALLIATPVAQAEIVSLSQLLQRIESQEQRIESLEAERSTLQAEFAAYSFGGDMNGGKNCDSCRKAVCSCEEPAWYAGYEATILRPYFSDIAFGSTFDNDYGVGHRFTIGYDGGGMGIRARYWSYRHSFPIVPPPPPAFGVQMDVLDLEFTLDEHMSEWDFMVAAGLRYGREQVYIGTTTYEGIGITVAAEATHNIGCRGLFVVANVRGSLLFGEVRSAVLAGGPVIDGELMTVVESQLGVGWVRETRFGELNLRALAEAQGWFNDTIADPQFGNNGGIGGNLGLFGLTLSAELRY